MCGALRGAAAARPTSLCRSPSTACLAHLVRRRCCKSQACATPLQLPSGASPVAKECHPLQPRQQLLGRSGRHSARSSPRCCTCRRLLQTAEHKSRVSMCAARSQGVVVNTVMLSACPSCTLEQCTLEQQVALHTHDLRDAYVRRAKTSNPECERVNIDMWTNAKRTPAWRCQHQTQCQQQSFCRRQEARRRRQPSCHGPRGHRCGSGPAVTARTQLLCTDERAY